MMVLLSIMAHRPYEYCIDIDEADEMIKNAESKDKEAYSLMENKLGRKYASNNISNSDKL